jgi:Mlc titration factor MtfA (ptsG expression regulator)
MKAIYKINLFFILFYFLLILCLGILSFFLFQQNILIIWSSLLIGLFYLALAFYRPLKRLRALRRETGAAERDFLTAHSAFYRHIDEAGKRHFEIDIRIFLSDFRITGIRQEPVDDNTRLLIAAGVATLIHGRPDWEPPFRDGIVVYPGKSFDQKYQTGRGHIAGQAHYHGPLLLTRENLDRSFENPHDGYNVVFHEMAHYFDFEDGKADGIPSLGMASHSIYSWREVILDEWKKVNRGRSFLDPYAGLNEAEFFAVSTEFFFEKPWVMAKKNPELYRMLSDFYNIDTLKIFQSTV